MTRRAALLDYAAPADDAAEAAAVWRVAWWGGLIWTTAEVAFWLPLTWQTLDEGFRVPGFPWKTVALRLIVVARFALSGVLAAMLLLGRQRGMAWWIGVALVALVAAYYAIAISSASTLGGPLVGGISAALVVLAEVGGLLLFLAVAGRLIRADRRRMALLTAAPLLAAVAAYGISFVIGLSSVSGTTNIYVQVHRIIDHATHALLLLGSVVLLTSARSMGRRPFIIAALLTATAYCGGYAAWRITLFWLGDYMGPGAILIALDATRTLLLAAPALALLAWRPPAPEPGR